MLKRTDTKKHNEITKERNNEKKNMSLVKQIAIKVWLEQVTFLTSFSLIGPQSKMCPNKQMGPISR